MNEDIINLVVDNAALRLGCERSLKLLLDPDASEFDANKLIALLQTILKVNA